MPIQFMVAKNDRHFMRAASRAGRPLLADEEINALAVVVDDVLQNDWLEQMPANKKSLQGAPAIGQRIVFVAEEKGMNEAGQMMVNIWWMERELRGEQELGSFPGPDPWAPMVAPGPLSGADQSNVIFVIYALLYTALTDFARSVVVLIFEVCMVDCPKSWSGLLALGAARVLGIQDTAALVAFLWAAEILFTEQNGIVWAAEPQLGFFVQFLNAALCANMPVVVAAVHEHAAQMGMSHSEAVEYLARQFRVEARWLAAAGAPTYEPLRWMLRRTPRPQAAFAWTKIRNVLADHELPWGVDLMERRAADCNQDFWWQGQGGGIQERERVKTNWTNKAQTKLSCLHRTPSCFGTFCDWQHMCKLCRKDPDVFARDPCLAKFASGSGRTNCYGPKDFSESCWSHMCKFCRQDPDVFARDPCLAKTDHNSGIKNCYGPDSSKGTKCRTCSGSTHDKRKREDGTSGRVCERSALQVAPCPECGRQVKTCRAAHRDNRPPRGSLVVCQGCSSGPYLEYGLE